MKARTSLARKTLVRLALRMGVVIVVMTAISYYFVASVVTQRSVEYLSRYIEQRALYESNLFKIAESNHQFLKEELQKTLSGPPSPENLAGFSDHYLPLPDGTIRQALENHDGQTDAFGFVGKGVPVDDELKNKVAVFHEMSERYGPAWHHMLQNLYFTAPENLLVGYWPEYPQWSYDLPPDFDITTEEYFYVSNTELNPARQPAWTGLFYDIGSASWMVSLETPVDVNGRHVATIGHDILLNELLDRFLNAHLDDDFSIVFRDDGRLIFHPDKMEEIKQNNGVYDIQTSGDPALIDMFETVTSNEKVRGPGDWFELNNHYLLTARIGGPGWNMVTVFPKQSITGPAYATASVVLVIGILALLLEMLFLWSVLRDEIAKPVEGFLHRLEETGESGELLQLDDTLDDELGEFARTFNRLNREIHDRTSEMQAVQLQLNRAITGSSDGLWEWNILTGYDYFSPRWLEILGYDQGDLEPHLDTFIELIHEDDQEKVQQAMTSHLADSETFNVDFRLRHRDGHYVWVNSRGKAERDERGEPVIMAGFITDITEKREMDIELEEYRHHLESLIRDRTSEYLQAKEEAERASQAKSEFLSRMSHELRTPMNAVLGFAQLLQMDDALDATRRGYVERILKAGDHLLELINDVLDISKIEAGEMSLEISEVNLPEVINDSLMVVSPQARNRGIKISASCELPDEATIRSSPTNLKIILGNLLSNAVKYSETGGEVSVFCEPLGDEMLRLAVSDSGPGLTREEQAAVFEPFNRAWADSSEIEGVGIGLTITQKVVTLLGGEIHVVSQPGKGSTFYVDLPLDLRRADAD